MIRYSEKDFINEIKLMVSNNASEQEISYRALELMNSSIDWREEFRDFALDLISIIAPGFYMTNDEILKNIIHEMNIGKYHTYVEKDIKNLK